MFNHYPLINLPASLLFLCGSAGLILPLICLHHFLSIPLLLLLPVTLYDSGAAAPSLGSLRRQGSSEGHM